MRPVVPNEWIANDWTPIIENVRLSHAEAALRAWLVERGLTANDIPKADLAQEVGRRVGGGTLCTYYVRRSRLEQLEARGDADNS